MTTLEATAPAPAERERALALGAALVTVSLWAFGFRRHPLGVLCLAVVYIAQRR